MGAHICSWFVISGYEARWERIITAFGFNYSAFILFSYFVDSYSFTFPLVLLLSSMVVTTYLMREVGSNVPVIVNNITALWFVCVFLTQPYQPLIGVVIGIFHYLLATTTPNMLGFDLFYPVAPLKWFC